MKKLYDVITVGSAFQDVYVLSKRFRIVRDPRVITGESQCFAFGTKIELDDILFEVGGGATNSAYTFRRQGLRVGCITRIGADGAGKEVQSFLRHSRIGDHSVIDREKRTAHSVIFLGTGGERTILVYRGASHAFRSSDIFLPVLRRTSWLYVTSLAGNTTLFRKIVTYARRNGIHVAINPGKLEIRKSRGIVNSIFRTADIVFLNREEASIVAGLPPDDMMPLLKSLDRMTPGIVVITDGSRGSYAILNHTMYRVIITPVNAVDTTGAGDAFGSGFLAGYIRSRGDIKKALTLATKNAASVIKKIGAKHGLLSRHGTVPNLRMSISIETVK
ncbi:MAG: carbohydrate kinase family protein [Patescibacteria group bacterium]